MNKLTLSSILTLIDQLSYEDNEKLEDMIINKKLNKYYRIEIVNSTNNFLYSGIKANNEDEAIKIFITTHNSFYDEKLLLNLSETQCCICQKDIKDITSNMVEHIRSHSDNETFNCHKLRFKKFYKCIQLNSDNLFINRS